MITIDWAKVRVILAQRDWTQRDLSFRADIGEVTLVRLKQGEAFMSTTLEKLAEALDCDPRELIAWERGK